MSVQDNLKLDEEEIAAWNAHDVERAVAIFPDDVVWIDTASPQPLNGKDAVRRDLTAGAGIDDGDRAEHLLLHLGLAGLDALQFDLRRGEVAVQEPLVAGADQLLVRVLVRGVRRLARVERGHVQLQLVERGRRGAQELADRADVRLLHGYGAPIEPAQRVVLGVGVVVAQLRAAHLIAHEQHGLALRDEERSQKVFDLLQAQGFDLRVLRGALHPAVPAEIVARTILTIFAVGEVVFIVITDQVVKGEAIVGGDEVDAAVGVALRLDVEVGRAAQAVGKVTRQAHVAAQEAAGDGPYRGLVQLAASFINTHADQIGARPERPRLTEVWPTPLGPDYSCEGCAAAELTETAEAEE